MSTCGEFGFTGGTFEPLEHRRRRGERLSLVERSTLSETPLAKPLKTRAGADALVEHEARDELDEDDGVDGALGQGPGVAAGVDPVVGRPRRVVVDLADLEGDVVLRTRERVVRDARVVVREHVRDDDVAAQPDDEVGQRVRRLEAREAEDGHELRVRLAREVREDHRHERERRHEEDAAEALAPPLVEVDRAPDGAEVRALPAQDAVPVDEVRDEPVPHWSGRSRPNLSSSVESKLIRPTFGRIALVELLTQGRRLASKLSLTLKSSRRCDFGAATNQQSAPPSTQPTMIAMRAMSAWAAKG